MQAGAGAGAIRKGCWNHKIYHAYTIISMFHVSHSRHDRRTHFQVAVMLEVVPQQFWDGLIGKATE